MKNYAQCMTDEELVQELKSRAMDQRTAAEQAVRDDLHCNPLAGSTHEDLADLLDESATRLGHQSRQPTVKEDLWKPDPYAGPQGESIRGEGVRLEVWSNGDWSVLWFGNGFIFGHEESRTLAKAAAIAKFKTLVGRLRMQYERANALDDRL